MNQTDFNTILQQPQSISSEHTKDLHDVIEEFPYFQSARALYLKALKNADSYKYNHNLKKTATYTTDRSILFDFITSKVFLQNEISQSIKKNTANLHAIDVIVEDISVNKSMIIDEALKQHVEAAKDILDPELFQPKIQAKKIANFELDNSHPIEDAVINEDKEDETVAAETILNLGKPLVFDLSETHSFNEWLSLTQFKPIERNEKEETKKEKNTLDKQKKFALIDAFISKNPKIKPTSEFASNRNIAKAQMIQPEALMTETLARIYLEQKNYKKAIQSYKILSLKYPEKSGFFADQIKAVKQLQEKNKEE